METLGSNLSSTASDLLLVVDVQNDFCNGGALAVPNGDDVVPVVNRLLRIFPHAVFTQDWHPAGHLSFASSHENRKPFESIEAPYGEQALWPDHCVQGTEGAEFHPDLETKRCELILRKGHNKEVDSYSAFFENDHTTSTGLAGCLLERRIKRLFFAGLATDFCVLYSALDAKSLGFESFIIEDACRGVNMGGSLNKAWEAAEKAGVGKIKVSEIPDTALA